MKGERELSESGNLRGSSVVTCWLERRVRSKLGEQFNHALHLFGTNNKAAKSAKSAKIHSPSAEPPPHHPATFEKRSAVLAGA